MLSVLLFSLWWDRFCVCVCVFCLFGWRMANFVRNFIEWENERMCVRVCVCLVSPSALTLFEWLVIGACHIWLLHIKCVLMRDDIALFHLKQNQRNNFSLSALLFVANFFASPSFSFFIFLFGVFSALSISFVCARMVRLLLWCEHNLRYDDKTIWIMFVPLQLVVLCVQCTYIFFFHLSERSFFLFFLFFALECVSVWASLFAWIFHQYYTHQKCLLINHRQYFSVLFSLFLFGYFWEIACLAPMAGS